MPRKYLASKLIKLTLAVAVCLTLVFLNPKKIFNPAKEVFFKAAYPFQKTFYIMGKKTGNFFGLLVSISDLKKENERIMKENASLSAAIADLREQKKENEILRNQLELAPRQKFRLESAFIIGQDPRGSGSWLVADKGRSDGIDSGMPVIVSDGILVGRVSEVYDKSARIVLLTDSSSSVNVMDLETEARGILSGEYNLGLVMELVGQTEVLNKGDDVITSGLGGSIPKGLLIGKIQQVESTQDKLFQKALISAKVKYSDLDVVFIIKSSF